MELRQLRYFLAVTEDLHFTRAAQRLHVAQPALSAQIRALEREVGGELLVRSTRNVQLTDAGRALAEEAARVLAATDRALAEARSIVRRSGQTLAVGCLGAPGDVLDEALDALARRQPEATVDLQTFDYVTMWSGLRDGKVDVALAYLPFDVFEIDGLDVLPIMDEPRVVVLSSSHRLADREALRPADLADEVFITHPDEVPQSWRDFWLLADQLGHRPAVHDVRADTVEKWLHLVQRGGFVDTCPAYVSRYYTWPALRYIPLRDAPPTKLALLRRRHSTSPLAEAFRDAVLTAVAEHAAPRSWSPDGRRVQHPPR